MKVVLMAVMICLGWSIGPWTPQAGAAEGKRVALLIGNAAYGNSPLRNPPQDVREMEAALKSVGFRVEKVLDANQNQMKRAVRDFGTLAQGAEIAFLYYSGHGTQANGENYLIPIKATIEKEADYEVETVSANALMRQIAGARPQAAIVVLDACRDNPYAAVTKGSSKGLGRMDAPTGTMIAFATAPNTTAGDEGHYARVLAAQIKTSGLELFDVFRNTSAEVKRLTGGKQEPRLSEVSISERIYLAGQVRVAPSPPAQLASVQPAPVPVPATAQADAPPVAGQVIKDCADCPEMVVIPAGKFMMGTSAAELMVLKKSPWVIENFTHSYDEESPRHEVKIGSALAVGRTEVTVGEYARFVSAKAYRTDAEKGDGCYVLKSDGGDWKKRAEANWKAPGFAQTDQHPVVCVSWNDAQAYVKWLAKKTEKGYRLLSEAEWEYAARGGSSARYPWGDDADYKNICGYANHADRSYADKYPKDTSVNKICSDGTVLVAETKHYPANGFGLYDMHGNAMEWVEDCAHKNYAGAPSDGRAWTSACEKAEGGVGRMARGGSWYNSPVNLRSAYRFGGEPSMRASAGGFRVARAL
ncbi:SUMF1/EgtB/PvdO family nonheme iron enzyme [Propionivibrio sp.]|uniref:SUMF1/EgtB/PvdO family nonheme iron enzyme n=1 Tax=Propionivibrio sp. TaxID=2212460 RepID=UPI003BF15849